MIDQAHYSSVRPVVRQTLSISFGWWRSPRCRTTAKRYGFMKLIPLTRGLFAKVDDFDYEYLSKYKWCASRSHAGYYAVRSVGRYPSKTFAMHRVILGISDLRQVDHRDGDGLNNQKENLRPATNAQNHGNRKRPANNTSGYKGVTLTPSGKWKGMIEVLGRSIYLGIFTKAEDAARAYDISARQHFGEFARLNFQEHDEVHH
jgi:hypothetical protein